MTKIRKHIVILFGGGLFVSFYYLNHVEPFASYMEYFNWIPYFIIYAYIMKKVGDAEKEFRLMEMQLEDFEADNKNLSATNQANARRIAELESGARSSIEANKAGYDYPTAINMAYAEIYKKRYGDAYYTRLALTEIASSPNEAIGSLVNLSYLNGISDMGATAVEISNSFVRQRKNTLNVPQQIAALIHKASEQLLPPVRYDTQKN